MSAELVRVPVPGTDKQIMAMSVNGEPVISLRHVCDAIGIALESQKRKLTTRSWATTTQQVAVAEDGKRRTMTMIDRRTLMMWLGGIDENRVNPDIRPTLVAFQSQAAIALDAYFNEGGAVNPNATEDQLERISRQVQAQAAALNALKGIVDAKHLEAKGRLLVARAMGEAPELDPATLPLYVWDYLKSKGLARPLIEAKASGFGKRLKALYTVQHDRAPEKHHQDVNGKVREVYAYTEADRSLFDSVWARHYANAVAETALRVVPGGDSA